MQLFKAARLYSFFVLVLVLAAGSKAHATVFCEIQGIVHDPQHRPIANASVVLKSQNSDLTQSTTTNSDGAFRFTAVPFGDYSVTVSQSGFAGFKQPLSLASNT